ncbi:LysR family transcriptional regulator [Paraburkholderia sp. 1N]|jgi:DNA-binding transcriptional LysR family regulator|uniref:LysR family transcriptional regulator n=1 Tax=Paraburkholderia solitsugae TaxID=2675748 RepID=A0ABX2BTC7_9BURK|nr:LysR family transcriptional regulator [Paraburkholderia solitsugae]NPT44016.1 LysR family transcriptional regulator [Paraburkholderia solitsugae]
MSDILDGVTTFVRVVETGSFALAAERMNLTRSAVGKVIVRLEKRLGVRLLNRTTRSQSLTEDGQAYYDRCVRALAELEAAEADLDSGRREPKGRLRVSVPQAFGHHCVAPVLLGLARRHPQLKVDISISDRFVDVVEEGFDLVVRIGPLPDSASLAARRLGVQYASIGAAPSYLAQRGKPRNVNELRGHTIIAYMRAGAAQPWDVVDVDGQIRRAQVEPQLGFDDMQGIVDAAIAGFGLAWLPSWLLARYAATGQLVSVMENCFRPSQEIHVVWPKSRYLALKTRCAIDALVAEIPTMVGMQPAN